MGAVLIIAGGPLDAAFGMEYIAQGTWEYVIAVDAGLAFCQHAGLVPDLILGDFDSAQAQTVRYYRERMPERFRQFPAHKDYTDTELALQEAYRIPCERIEILGALGGRLDHTLGNLALLRQALDHGKCCRLADVKNRVHMISRRTVLTRSALYAGKLSLVPFGGPVTGLTLAGFAYEVTDLTLSAATTRGISNEVTADTAVIDLKEGALLVVESRD